jgi:SAM-dependent methyltransferase
MLSDIDGYTREIDYTHGYSSILSPTHLRLVALNHCIPFPARRPLRYLELGCGNGVSLNIHAAASPGEYWGVDANPSHVAFASDLAQASGANVRILGMSFAELLKYQGLPDFDVIVANGVWSWVSDENRRCIVELLRRKLTDGGIFYVSYNALPGCAGIIPLQQILMLHSKKSEQSDGILERLAAAIQFTIELRDAGSEFFARTPAAAECLSSMKSRNPAYLCHEYLNAHWRPLSFYETVDTLSEVGLLFMANADSVEYYDDLAFDEKSLTLLNSVRDPLLRETASDMLRNRQFRRDIFVRGSPSLSPADRMAALCRMEFALVTPPDDIPEAVNFGLASYSLSATPCREILEVLAGDHFRSKTVAELTSMPSLASVDHSAIIRALLFLTTIELVHPVQPRDRVAIAIETCRKINLEVFRRASSLNIRALASPVLGNGTYLPRHWRHFLESIFSGAVDPGAWASRAWKLSQNKGSTTDGKYRLAKGAQVLKDAVTFQRQLPLFQSLGIDFNDFKDHPT